MTILNYDFATNASDICSDLVIEVDDKGVITEYFAHRFVISRRSPALQSIISSLPLRMPQNDIYIANLFEIVASLFPQFP